MKSKQEVGYLRLDAADDATRVRDREAAPTFKVVAWSFLRYSAGIRG